VEPGGIQQEGYNRRDTTGGIQQEVKDSRLIEKWQERNDKVRRVRRKNKC
jgi:hypothetical protein